MEENVNARIVLGGKIVNFKGRMAGIFEEAICAIQKKHPIYDELKKFENKDYQVLRNGLDKDENEILFNSINIPEIISLILKGINKAFNY